MHKYLENAGKDRRSSKSLYLDRLSPTESPISVIAFTATPENSQEIIEFTMNIQEIGFGQVFRDYHYIIKAVKITEKKRTEKLYFNTNYNITLVNRKWFYEVFSK